MRFIWCFTVSLLIGLPRVSLATDFLDADTLSLSTRTTYFLNFAVDGRKVELEVDAAEYQLISRLNKLGLRDALDDADENTRNLVASLNQKAVEHSGKPIVIDSEEGFRLYRSVADTANPMFQVLARGLLYRGEELNLTEKETAIIRALVAAPDREMTFQDLASAVGWNGRNYRTNVRNYMESINVKTWEMTGAELLKVEGRGKAIQLAPVEPATYTEKGYGRVHGRIVPLEGAALILSDIYGPAVREELPKEFNVSETDLRTINLTPHELLVGLRGLFSAVAVSPDKVKVLAYLGGKSMGIYLDGSDGEHFSQGRSYCGHFL